MMKNLLFFIFFQFATESVLHAYPVYLRQVVYNRTPYELYFGMRPVYRYPNWSCQGPIPAYSMMVCHDQYDNQNSNFWLQIINTYVPAKIDHAETIKIPALLYAAQGEIVWNIYYNPWLKNYRFDFNVN